MNKLLAEAEARVQNLSELMCKKYNHISSEDKNKMNYLVAKAKWDISSARIYKTEQSLTQANQSISKLIAGYESMSQHYAA